MRMYSHWHTNNVPKQAISELFTNIGNGHARSVSCSKSNSISTLHEVVHLRNSYLIAYWM